MLYSGNLIRVAVGSCRGRGLQVAVGGCGWSLVDASGRGWLHAVGRWWLQVAWATGAWPLVAAGGGNSYRDRRSWSNNFLTFFSII